MKAERLSEALSLLPEHLEQIVLRWSEHNFAPIEELRLRMGQSLSVLNGRGETILPSDKICAQDLQTVLDRATEFSTYRCAESIRNGYITIRGGCRVGICGTAIVRGGEIATIQDVSSVAIRVAREIRGVSDLIYPQLWHGGQFESTLLIAPPGYGKTTYLRDLIRLLSAGSSIYTPLRVAVVDERCEIAASLGGIPQFDLGSHTDVLSACAKAEGLLMVLRSMNPEIIAVDEITAPADISAMSLANNCGVAFLATVHGRDLQEIRHRRICKELLDADLFHQFVILEKRGEERCFRVERC